MKKKELKRLSRLQLMEIMVEQEKENNRLRKRVQELEEKLADRTLRVSNAGSLAEAALAVNGFFEAADAACQQYRENLQGMYDELQLCRDAAPQMGQPGEELH